MAQDIGIDTLLQVFHTRANQVSAGVAVMPNRLTRASSFRCQQVCALVNAGKLESGL